MSCSTRYDTTYAYCVRIIKYTNNIHSLMLKYIMKHQEEHLLSTLPTHSNRGSYSLV